MSDKQLEVLVMCLKSGEYDGVHIMQARMAVKELIEIRAERDALKGELEKALQAVQFYANQASYSSSWDPAKRNPIHAMEDKGRVAKNALSSIFDERLG